MITNEETTDKVTTALPYTGVWVIYLHCDINEHKQIYTCIGLTFIKTHIVDTMRNKIIQWWSMNPNNPQHQLLAPLKQVALRTTQVGCKHKILKDF